MDVLTVPEIVIDAVRSPSTSSVAVAPGSVKVSPTVRLIVDEPTKVITGGVVSVVVDVLVVEVLVVEVATTVNSPETVIDVVASCLGAAS